MGIGTGRQGVQPAIRNWLIPQEGIQATSTAVTEDGPGGLHKTTITVKGLNLGAIAGAANEATGALAYTLPAGAIVVKSAYMSIGLTNTDGNIDADTPDLGIGTTVASGAVAVLSGTAAFENILTGQTAGDVTGTATVKTVADQILVIEASGDHTVYLNIADGWAGAETTGVVATGTIVLEWVLMA